MPIGDISGLFEDDEDDEDEGDIIEAEYRRL
jgi:hypothetical protein